MLYRSLPAGILMVLYALCCFSIWTCDAKSHTIQPGLQPLGASGASGPTFRPDGSNDIAVRHRESNQTKKCATNRTEPRNAILDRPTPSAV
jgi:hypothetical protein